MKSSKIKNILLAMMGVLVIAEFVLRISRINSATITGVLMLLVMAFVVLYGFWLYKKPHGNLLKYTMLLFAFVTILISGYYLSISSASGVTRAMYFGKLITAGLVCYCAGRLNKIKQNKIIFPIIDVFLLAYGIWGCVVSKNVTFTYAFNFFETFIIFTTIMIAYFVRYQEHHEAGLLDKKDAKKMIG